MKKSNLQLGGELNIGDLIAIGGVNNVYLAWYAGATPGGNMRVITLNSPSTSKYQHDGYVSGKYQGAYYKKQFGNGFTFKSINTDLIINSYLRAVKVDNSIITDSHVLKNYEENKQILLDFNFPAK